MKVSGLATLLLASAGLAVAIPAPTPVAEAAPQETSLPFNMRLCDDRNLGGFCTNTTFFVGPGRCFNVPSNMNDRTTSFDAPWDGVNCYFFEHANCGGASFSGRGYWGYVGDGWNNRVSSFSCNWA